MKWSHNYASTEEPISKTPANNRIAGRLKRSNSLVAVILVIACIANRCLVACVGKIIIEINFDKNNLSDQQKEKLVAVAKGCPVAQSLSTDLIQEVKFNF